MRRSSGKKSTKRLTTQRAVDTRVKDICNIMRRGNCKGAMQYVPELTWILFLRILDEREQREAVEAQMFGREFIPSMAEPFRWHDWAATPLEDDSLLTERNGKLEGWKRRELTEGVSNGFIAWVNTELLPYLQKLKEQPNATPRQKVISEIMSSVERVRIDTD